MNQIAVGHLSIASRILEPRAWPSASVPSAFDLAEGFLAPRDALAPAAVDCVSDGPPQLIVSDSLTVSLAGFRKAALALASAVCAGIFL